MTSRQFLSVEEKQCLQELIVKYKLNSTATITARNVAVKRTAWTNLTNEFNSIESNTRRTEAQLKKCFDNMKTKRKKDLLTIKKDRMRTGGGPHQRSPEPTASTSQDAMLIDSNVLADLTDVEMTKTIDSDTPEVEWLQENAPGLDDTMVIIMPDTEETSEQQCTETLDECTNTVPGEDQPVTGQRKGKARTSSRLSDYGGASSLTSGPRNNIRAQVIQEEFSLREESYKRAQEREEELHRLKLAEREWQVKTAEELFKKACLEREAAQIILNNLKNYFLFCFYPYLLVLSIMYVGLSLILFTNYSYPPSYKK